MHRHLPRRLPHHHGARGGGRAAHAADGARAQPEAAVVRVGGAAADAARDGQGRGHLPPLRPVRRALPHRRLGHAEIRGAAAVCRPPRRAGGGHPLSPCTGPGRSLVATACGTYRSEDQRPRTGPRSSGAESLSARRTGVRVPGGRRPARTAPAVHPRGPHDSPV